MSASSREPPCAQPALAGRLARKRPTAPATSSARIRRATTEGVRKLSRRKCGERVADPVLVARDDRGVRDRQAERVAEQRGDREPVGEAADQPRLGEGADEAPGRMERRRGRVAAMNTAAMPASIAVASARMPRAPLCAGLRRPRPAAETGSCRLNNRRRPLVQAAAGRCPTPPACGAGALGVLRRRW